MYNIIMFINEVKALMNVQIVKCLTFSKAKFIREHFHEYHEIIQLIIMFLGHRKII